MAKQFKYLVQFTVADVWVADGFDMTDQRALDMLSHDLSHANIGTELDAQVILSPDALRVARKQGYKNASQVNKDRSDDRNHPVVGDLLNALRCAYTKLDSVTHLSKEGDTDEIKADLAVWIERLA